MDEDLLASEIGDEDFFDQAAAWQPDAHAPARKAMVDSLATVTGNRRKPAKGAGAKKGATRKRRG